MPAILTINYDYVSLSKPWFTKKFSNFEDLFKWLREDSIIIIPDSLLSNERLKKQLILTKLALPKTNIMIISSNHEEQDSHFFIYVEEEKLQEHIKKAIINKHRIINNRKTLLEVLESL